METTLSLLLLSFVSLALLETSVVWASQIQPGGQRQEDSGLNPFTIICSPHQDVDGDFVSLHIHKDMKQTIATMDTRSTERGPRTRPSVKFNGHVDIHNVTRSFLSVTFQDPLIGDSGLYGCTVSLINRSTGDLQEYTDSKYINVEDTDDPTNSTLKSETAATATPVGKAGRNSGMISLIKDQGHERKINQLKDVITAQSETIKELQAAHRNQTTQLDAQATQLNVQATQLNAQATQLNAQTTQLNVQATQLSDQATLFREQATQLSHQGEQLSYQREQLMELVNNMQRLENAFLNQSTPTANQEGPIVNKTDESGDRRVNAMVGYLRTKQQVLYDKSDQQASQLKRQENKVKEQDVHLNGMTAKLQRLEEAFLNRSREASDDAVEVLSTKTEGLEERISSVYNVTSRQETHLYGLDELLRETRSHLDDVDSWVAEVSKTLGSFNGTLLNYSTVIADVEGQGRKIKDFEDLISIQSKTIADLQIQLLSQGKTNKNQTEDLKLQGLELTSHIRSSDQRALDMKHTVSELRTELAGVRNLARRLSNRTAHLDNEVTAKLQHFEDLVLDHNKTTLDVSAKINQLEILGKNHSHLIGELLHEDSYACAFSCSHNPSHTLIKDGTMAFGKVLLNVGNAYDVIGGLFTAPVRGVYVFHLFVRTNYFGGQVNIYIKARGTAVAELFTGRRDWWTQTSISVGLSLEVGDRVEPVMAGSELGMNCCYQAVFTGYLLKQL